MKNTIPPVGTEVVFGRGDTVVSRDGTHVCRIHYDTSVATWIIVPPSVNRGLLVFLSETPDWTVHTRFRITSIQPTGKGVYAEPVSLV